MAERISEQVDKVGRGRLVEEGEDQGQGDQQLGLAAVANTKQSSVPSGVRLDSFENRPCLLNRVPSTAFAGSLHIRNKMHVCPWHK